MVPSSWGGWRTKELFREERLITRRSNIHKMMDGGRTMEKRSWYRCDNLYIFIDNRLIHHLGKGCFLSFNCPQTSRWRSSLSLNQHTTRADPMTVAIQFVTLMTQNKSKNRNTLLTKERILITRILNPFCCLAFFLPILLIPHSFCLSGRVKIILSGR